MKRRGEIFLFYLSFRFQFNYRIIIILKFI